MKNNKSLIMILLILLLIIIGVCIYFFIIKDNKKLDNSGIGSDNEPLKEISYPYNDDEGRIRYKMVINGKELETENLPFKLTEEEKGAYFPIKDILNSLGIDVLESDDKTILATKLNDNIIRVNADQGKMVYGKSTLQAADRSIKTIIVDGVLYVPSFFFMKFTNNTIVDFSSDNTSATLTTDLVVDSSTSGISSVSLTENSGGTTNGYHICSKCHGSGGYNELYNAKTYVNGQVVYNTQYKWVKCPVCGGTGHIHE